jgi:hypothetical protein
LSKTSACLMEDTLWISPSITRRSFGYSDNIELSFDGVRTRTFTLYPAARQFFNPRPVPPVAPKIARVEFADVVEDIVYRYLQFQFYQRQVICGKLMSIISSTCRLLPSSVSKRCRCGREPENLTLLITWAASMCILFRIVCTSKNHSIRRLDN